MNPREITCNIHDVFFAFDANRVDYNCTLGCFECPCCRAELDDMHAEDYRRELNAELAYERHLENRWDEDAQRDLAYHNELWPTYYGCPTDPGALV